MKFIYFIFGLLILLNITSCQQDNLFDQFKSIDQKEWLYTSPATFDFHVDDIHKKYAVYVQVRHTNAYPFSNLYILVHQKNPKNTTLNYRKEIKLAELDGKWIGINSGNLYVTKSLISKNYSFPDTGQYRISIEQNMRDNPLKEITDIGLIVTEEK